MPTDAEREALAVTAERLNAPPTALLGVTIVERALMPADKAALVHNGEVVAIIDIGPEPEEKRDGE